MCRRVLRVPYYKNAMTITTPLLLPCTLSQRILLTPSNRKLTSKTIALNKYDWFFLHHYKPHTLSFFLPNFHYYSVLIGVRGNVWRVWPTCSSLFVLKLGNPEHPQTGAQRLAVKVPPGLGYIYLLPKTEQEQTHLAAKYLHPRWYIHL